MKVPFAALALSVAVLLASSLLTRGQVRAKRISVASRLALQKELWDADQQWLCSSGTGPYHKDYKECIEFRNQYWTDQFFEISPEGQVQTKAEMIAAQRAAHPSPGVGPYPDDFKLMAIYGNVALATDHTRLKRQSADAKASWIEVRVFRSSTKADATCS